jgi:Flp pilus assembly protein TadB
MERTPMAELERAAEVGRLLALAELRPGDAVFSAACAGIALWHGHWVAVVLALVAGAAVNVAWKVWLRRKRAEYRAKWKGEVG